MRPILSVDIERVCLCHTDSTICAGAAAEQPCVQPANTDRKKCEERVGLCVKGSLAQRMRAKERCPWLRMPLPELQKLGEAERKKREAGIEIPAGAEDRSGL